MTAAGDKPVVLGRVSGLFGVRGWVKVHSFTEPRQAILEYERWRLGRGGSWKEVMLAEGRPHGNGVIVRFDGVEDRDTARALVDCEIGVARGDMPEPESGRYYWADLEGLRVRRRDGRMLGSVGYLLATGVHDVLVVDGDQERLIPFIPGDTVVDVDLDQGEIIVDWDWE